MTGRGISPVRVAAVQASRVFLDRSATTTKACDLVREAAGEDARLVVFPDSFIPCYPDWVWRQRPWDDGESDWHVRFSGQSVTIPGSETEMICEVAAATKTFVAVGVTELSSTRGTLYNSLV